jgi:signal peptidase I
MMPTLLVGDLILVNKFHYGVRLPVINKKIIPINDPQRGDVMVFRYPSEPSMDYIKRVVGLPGDEVAYRNQQLYLNGQLVAAQRKDDFLDEETTAPSEVDASGRAPEKSSRYVPQFSEKLGSIDHRILVNPERMASFHPIVDFPNRDHCRYSPEGGVTCKVPAGHYFMMGDNRDNSQDSRYWGFVPDANIVGKAFFVWMNFSSIKRIGPFQ